MPFHPTEPCRRSPASPFRGAPPFQAVHSRDSRPIRRWREKGQARSSHPSQAAAGGTGVSREGASEALAGTPEDRRPPVPPQAGRGRGGDGRGRSGPGGGWRGSRPAAACRRQHPLRSLSRDPLAGSGSIPPLFRHGLFPPLSTRRRRRGRRQPPSRGRNPRGSCDGRHSSCPGDCRDSG